MLGIRSGRVFWLVLLAILPVRTGRSTRADVTILLPTSITAATEWHYTLTRPTGDWSASGYDASSWDHGPTGFGNAVPAGGRRGTAWTTGDIWLRTDFDLTQIPRFPALRMAHDEDVEVFINGVLAARAGGFTTSYDDIDLSLEARDHLKVGKNSIAVHCHQTTGGQFIDVGLIDRVEPPRPALTMDQFAYANPIQFQGKSSHGEVRDPCIVRDGATYYLIFTVFPFRNREPDHLAEPDQGGSPGIKLYSSPDLRAWKFETWLVKSADLPENCPYKNRFWAPEIHQLGGKFYLIFTADNWIKPEYNPAGTWGTAGYAFVGVADKITGPFEHITYIPGAACDTTLFEDATGRTWAAIPRGNIDVQEIDLTHLTADKVTLLGRPKTIVTASNRDIGVAAQPDYLEGPWVERSGSKYTLFYAEIYKDKQYPDFLGYYTGAAYADSPLGPWTKDPRGKVFFGGHLAVFPGPDGRRWFSYRVEQDDRARGFLAIDPFTIDPAGQVQADEPTIGPRTVPLSAPK